MFAVAFAVALSSRPSPPTEPVCVLLHHTPDGAPVTRSSVRVAVSPDGKWVAVQETTRVNREWDFRFRLWDVSTGKVAHTRTDSTDIFYPQVFLGPATLAVTYGTNEANLRGTGGTAILSIPEMKVLHRFERRRLVALAPGGRTTLCLTDEGYELWDWTTQKTVRPLSLGSIPGRVAEVSFPADGRQFAARILPHGGGAPWVAIYDAGTGRLATSIEPVRMCAAIAPDGKSVAVAGDERFSRPDANWNMLGFWDAETRKVTRPARPKHELIPAEFLGLWYCPDGRHLILVGTSGLVLWDVPGEAAVDGAGEWGAGAARLVGRTEVSFASSAAGAYAAALTVDGELYVWKVTPPAKQP